MLENTISEDQNWKMFQGRVSTYCPKYAPDWVPVLLGKTLVPPLHLQLGCLPFDRKIWLGFESIIVSNFPVFCRTFTSVTVWIQKKVTICVAWVWNYTKKLVNGKQYFVWFIPTGMNGLPQNVLHLHFRSEKSPYHLYLPSGILKFSAKR